MNRKDGEASQEGPTVNKSGRDSKGRWLPGTSGNPTGRKQGTRDKRPRRQPGDIERAAEWSQFDWRIYFERIARAAPGTAADKHAKALAECVALWLLLNPPAVTIGMCSKCKRGLDPSQNSIDAAPIRVEGAWVHWSCMRWFLRARWDEAKMALRSLGLPVPGLPI